jgi:hypothetical protein
MSEPTKHAVHIDGPLAVLRRRKNVGNARDDELAALVARGGLWATRSVGVVIGALFIEALTPLLGPPGSWWDRGAEFVLNAIVALGIWGELALNGAASEAQKEQLRRALAANAQRADTALGLAGSAAGAAEDARSEAESKDEWSGPAAMNMASNARQTADEALREVTALAERLKDRR